MKNYAAAFFLTLLLPIAAVADMIVLQPADKKSVDNIGKIIVDQLQQCWSPPRNAEPQNVQLDIDISRNGEIKLVGFADPKAENTPAGQAAKRAALDPACNPLHQLPPTDKYHIWNEMRVTFEPRDLAN